MSFWTSIRHAVEQPFKSISHIPLVQPGLDAVALATGNPELIPLINGGLTYANTGSIGQGLASGAEGFGLQELAPVAGNAFASAFPDTASSFGIGGGANSLTDLFGQTTGGGSLTGPGTLGGDFMGNFSPNSGLSQLLGGTSTPSSDASTVFNSINSAAPNLTETAGATAPSNFASGGDYGAGGSPVPGASTGPGAIAPTAGGGGAGSIGGGAAQGGPAIGETPDTIGSAISGAQSGNAGTFGFDLNGQGTPPVSTGAGAGFGGTGSFDINGAPTGAASNSISGQFQSAGSTPSGGIMSGLSSLLGGNNAGGSSLTPVNGLINAGLGYLLNNPNTKGANQISGAANAANANYQPFLTAGTGAENTLSNLYGNNGAAAQTAAQQNFQTTPGYQFALNQGENAVNANAAAMGNPLSGNNEEAINNYAQGTASQQYNNYVNQLQNMASGGMTAAGGIGSNLLTGAGAQAGANQNKANAGNTAIGTGLNALFPTGGINLQQLLSGGNTGSGGAGLLGLLGAA